VPARRYLVHGLVQGVGYRAFVWRLASRLGIAGWVRNRRDGTVEVLAVGDERALSELRRALERGPAFARVTRVEEWPAEQEPGLAGFEVRRDA